MPIAPLSHLYDHFVLTEAKLPFRPDTAFFRALAGVVNGAHLSLSGSQCRQGPQGSVLSLRSTLRSGTLAKWTPSMRVG
jgi:hypothetical protein